MITTNLKVISGTIKVIMGTDAEINEIDNYTIGIYDLDTIFYLTL